MKKLKQRRIRTGDIIHFLCLAAILLSTSLSADNIVTSGTTLRVVSGTSLVSPAALTLQNGSSLTNLGTVILSGNLTNQNVAVSTLGSGTIVMTGTALQTISGLNTFGNLTLNNAAGVNLGGNTTVNGVLTFTSGRLALGTSNLLLGTTATVAGAPTAASMVIATGTGEMRKSFSSAGSFSFPVGDNTGPVDYSPVTVSFTGGSFGAGNYVGVNLVNSAYPGASGSFINRYWNLTQSGITGFNCNATYKYVPADVTGTENLIYSLRITPSSVVYFSSTNTATDILPTKALLSLGFLPGYSIWQTKPST